MHIGHLYITFFVGSKLINKKKSLKRLLKHDVYFTILGHCTGYQIEMVNTALRAGVLTE